MNVIPVSLPIVKPPHDDEITPQNREKIVEEIHNDLKKRSDIATSEDVKSITQDALAEAFGEKSKI